MSKINFIKLKMFKIFDFFINYIIFTQKRKTIVSFKKLF